MTSKIPPPTLEELNERIAAVEELRAAWQGLPSKVPLDIELYCLYAVRDGMRPKRNYFHIVHSSNCAIHNKVSFFELPCNCGAQPTPVFTVQSPWMDIETAPKDGTWVLTLSWPWSKIPTSLYWDRYHWSDACEAYPSKKIAEWQPTHWMPLPAPPTHNSLSNDKKPDTTANLYPSWNHNGFTRYRRTQITELRPFTPGEELDPNVSISQIDCEGGSPKLGDMIARNPKNHGDQWLISAAYFREHFKRIDLSHNHGEGDPS